jgi:hypothetical protein
VVEQQVLSKADPFFQLQQGIVQPVTQAPIARLTNRDTLRRLHLDSQPLQATGVEALCLCHGLRQVQATFLFDPSEAGIAFVFVVRQ